MDAPVSALALPDGRSVRLAHNHFLGSVDSTTLSEKGIKITAWAISNPANGAPMPVAAFIVQSNRGIRFIEVPNADRPDIAQKFGEACQRSGLRLEIPLSLVPAPFDPDLKVYAFDGHEVATPLAFFEANNVIEQLRIRTAADFMRLVQTPSTRVDNKVLLAYSSVHALERFSKDFAVQAAAICVIGYRILEKDVASASIRATFKNVSESLLTQQPNIPRGFFLRWHTSMRLVCGYMAYQENDYDKAAEHFAAIIEFAPELESWPQALTNILLGVFLTGYMFFEKKDNQKAIEYWSQAEHILRKGATISVFQNFYAYGELGNAVRVAQECFIATVVAMNGGPNQNAAIAPVGRTIDLRQLGAIARLVDEKHRKPL